jgi:acetyl-CoA carboxylase carboxyl transferase subunit alpha
MLQYSTYSVISPEGCASILWKSADKAELAAEAMGITSDRLLELGLIDEIVPGAAGRLPSGPREDRGTPQEHAQTLPRRPAEPTHGQTAG